VSERLAFRGFVDSIYILFRFIFFSFTYFRIVFFERNNTSRLSSDKSRVKGDHLISSTMAALTRPTKASYQVHESVQVDTHGTCTCFSMKRSKGGLEKSAKRNRRFCTDVHVGFGTARSDFRSIIGQIEQLINNDLTHFFLSAYQLPLSFLGKFDECNQQIMKTIHSGKHHRKEKGLFFKFQISFCVYSITQFCEKRSGIMFPVKAKKDLPVHQLIINSVAVRGKLGPMTVWVSNREAAAVGAATNGQQLRPRPHPPQHRQQYEFPLQSRHWTQIFKADVKASRREYSTLDLSSNPVVLNPGEVRAIYIHSASPGDEGVVYDNSSNHPRNYWHPRHGVQNNIPARATPRYQDGFLAIHSAR
jgi:hypothetical protein